MSMKADLENFVSQEVVKGHRDAVAAVEDYVYNHIVSTSPVDTGAYRSNHHRTEGAPDYSFNPNKTASKEPSPVKNTGFANFFVANGAPYAQALEDGHSEQGKHIFASAYNSAKARFGL